METILTAVIGGVCVAVPSIVATISANRKSVALTTYRIDQLEKKVDKHNHLVERVAVVERDVTAAFRRIDEIIENH